MEPWEKSKQPSITQKQSGGEVEGGCIGEEKGEGGKNEEVVRLGSPPKEKGGGRMQKPGEEATEGQGEGSKTRAH